MAYPYSLQTLRTHWDGLIASLNCANEDHGLPPISETKATELFEDMVATYSAEGRHYHNLGHIQHMLTLAEDIGEPTTHPDVQLGIWLHDYYYDTANNGHAPGQLSNEQESRRCLCERFAGLIPEHILDSADAIVDATDYGKYGEFKEGQHTQDPTYKQLLIRDLDLHGLSQRRQFGKNTEAIRLENQHVTHANFIPGTQGFFKSVLAWENIYRTPHFQHREDLARDNLKFGMCWLQLAEKNLTSKGVLECAPKKPKHATVFRSPAVTTEKIALKAPNVAATQTEPVLV